MAERFAALARKDASIRKEAAKLKAQEREYAELREYREVHEKIKTEAKRDPVAFLEKYGGLSYDDVTQYLVNDKRPTPSLEVKEVRDEIQRLREEQEDRERRWVAQQREAERMAEDARQHSMEQTLQNFYTEVDNFVKNDKDSYELINLYGEQPLVANVIEEHHKRTGKLLSYKEASDLVEDHLAESAERAIGSKKLQARLATKKTDAEKKVEQRITEPQPRVDNGLTTSTTTSVVNATSNIDKDRLARAAAAWDRASISK
jgi:hypothetical protein